MKRFTILALVVFALAAVPAALADDGGSAPADQARANQAPASQAPAGQAPARQQQDGPGRAAVKTHVEILRLRLQIVRLRYQLHCRGGRNADKCTAFAQKVVDRLTTLDGNVQKRIDAIEQSCPSGSTDAKCKNADRKVAFLQKVDTHLQSLIKRIQDALSGAAPSSTPSSRGDSSTSDSALDQAASRLGQLAGSDG